jgi:hypothetical protein
VARCTSRRFGRWLPKLKERAAQIDPSIRAERADTPDKLKNANRFGVLLPAEEAITKDQ